MINKPRIFYVLTLVFTTSLCTFIYQTQTVKKDFKTDLIELSDIKYGLFNLDEWKLIISDILVKKINEFEIKSNDKKLLKSKISFFLSKELNSLEKRFYQQNSSNISGYFKNGVVSFTGTFDKIKKDIPIFSSQIITFIDSKQNKKLLKKYLVDQLNKYYKNTFSNLDYDKFNSILKKYNFLNKNQAITFLENKVVDLEAKLYVYKCIFILLVLIIIVSFFIIQEMDVFNYWILVLICFFLLILGLIMPMIEIDARILDFKMTFLNETIQFKNQVLYYKSKSIIEVVNVMMYKGEVDLFLVGFLILFFSVIFPLSKMISLMVLINFEKIRDNKFLTFLSFKTGKWSMADVMVVAIFMTYLGFSGVLSDQLTNIDNLSQKKEVLTTNKSNLEMGFITFTSFTILSIILSSRIYKFIKK